MRTTLKTSLAAFLFAIATISAQAQGVTVYQSDIYYYPNTSTFAILPVTSGVETGDQVTLEGSSRLINGFAFDYWASGIPANATAQVKFYDSTGATPGATLFDSGSFSVGNTDGKQLVFSQSDLGGGFNGTDEMTWTVKFTFTSGTVALLAGPSTPTHGGSYSDYWTYDASNGWKLLGNAGAPNQWVNFASTITAVPEPSTLALLGMGGLASMVIARRRK